MSVERIYVDFTGTQLELTLPASQNIAVVTEQTAPNIIEVATPGIIGPVGPAGTGSITIAEPFTAIVTGRLYHTTTSISITGLISSSLVPQTGSSNILTSFDLGSVVSPWRRVYVDTANGIYFASSSQTMVTVSAGLNYVQVGDSRITTESYGFGTTNIIKNYGSYVLLTVTGGMSIRSDGVRTPLAVSSQSVTYFSVNTQGVPVLGNFTYTPTAITGGFFYSGSEYFFGFD